MSLKGVRQLKELLIRYSDRDGSSRGVINWMNKDLVSFAAANPQLQVTTEIKRNCHPIVRGNYLNGNSKTICVKNLDPLGVYKNILLLRNQIGRKVSFFFLIAYTVI
jgi:large subunit ribosomal protein L43